MCQVPFAAAVEAAVYFELKAELGVGLERLPATSRFVKWCLTQVSPPWSSIPGGRSDQITACSAPA